MWEGLKILKKRISQTRNFAKELDKLFSQKKLLFEDFESFKEEIAANPSEGDLISGTGGIRKTRLKSINKGKSGGFRVCYFDYPKNNVLFLILIYQKNEKENLTTAEKKILKALTDVIKRT